MPGCRFWKDQPDGFHGWCQHPEAQPGTTCILNTEDQCVLREEEDPEALSCQDQADKGLCNECQLQPCDLREARPCTE